MAWTALKTHTDFGAIHENREGQIRLKVISLNMKILRNGFNIGLSDA